MTIFHFNVQSLKSKICEIESVLKDNPAHCLCINEHWLGGDELDSLVIGGFRLVSAFCRSESRHGGVAVYLRNEIISDDLKFSNLSVELHCEAAGIFLNQQATQIVTVYRSPSGDMDRQACTDNIFSNVDLPDLLVRPVELYHLSDHRGISVSFPGSNNNKCNKLRVNYRPVTNEGLCHLYYRFEATNFDLIDDPAADTELKFQSFIDTVSEMADDCFSLKSKMVDVNQQRSVKVNWFNDDLRKMRERLYTIDLISKQYPTLVSRREVNSYKQMYRAEICNVKRSAHDSFIKNSNNP